MICIGVCGQRTSLFDFDGFIHWLSGISQCNGLVFIHILSLYPLICKQGDTPSIISVVGADLTHPSTLIFDWLVYLVPGSVYKRTCFLITHAFLMTNLHGQLDTQVCTFSFLLS